MLEEVKQSIINAYAQKTGLQRAKISSMMDAETWFNAKKAVELGFADQVLYSVTNQIAADGYMFAKITTANAQLQKPIPEKEVPLETGTPHTQLDKRLELLKY